MISIIIPTLNEESVIEKTLKNFKSKLTAIPYELIVSDGKSTDRTAEIARGIADKVLVHSENRRQTIAEGRNVGGKAAAGEFLVFFDADCFIENPNAFFAHALKRFEDPKLTGLVSWVKVRPEMATFADKLVYAIFNRYLSLINNILGFGVSGGEFQMMRKSDFERLGGYNEKLAASEDMDMLGRLAKIGKASIDKNLIVYQTGRRAHKVGWPKLLYLWLANSLSMMLHKKSYSKEWEVVR
jgi:glycosyltransferase involved in cell wall biosynthesis